MSSDKDTKTGIGDLLGVAPYGEALKIAVEKGADTAQQFLYDICRPAAAEAGLLLRDHVRAYRAQHLIKIAEKAKGIVEMNSEGIQLLAHPRLVAEVVENGSWCEDEELQNLWAGLLASSCTEDGKDDSNLLISDILKRLTTAEAKLVKFACEKGDKFLSDETSVYSSGYRTTEAELLAVTGLPNTEVYRYHRKHVESLGLLNNSEHAIINHPQKPQVRVPYVQPTYLGLCFYVRCSGSRESLRKFFDAKKRQKSTLT
jgi:hypothetical protein